MRYPSFIPFIFACVVCLSPTISSAQDFPPPDDRKPALERLEHLKKVKLIEALDLKEDQAIKFFTREKEYRQAERKLILDRVRLAEDLELLVKTDAKDLDIVKKIGDMHDAEKKILNTRWDFIENVKEILTPKQLGQLVIFEHKFQQEIRRILGDIQRERRRTK